MLVMWIEDDRSLLLVVRTVDADKTLLLVVSQLL